MGDDERELLDVDVVGVLKEFRLSGVLNGEGVAFDCEFMGVDGAVDGVD